MRFTHHVAALPADLAPARAALDAWCSDEGLDQTADEIAIVAAELGANALRHGRADFLIEASVGARAVTVRTHQPVATGTPHRVAAAAPDVHGLAIVERVAQAWGWQREGAGLVVWARVARGA